MFDLSIFDSLYNKKLFKYMRPLDGEVVLYNFCISRPEIDFIYYDNFKVYLSMIGFDESDKFSCKHEMFLFQR